MTPVPQDFFVQWYAKHGRSFAWRGSDCSPFQILVTEMLLRQTRAEDVDGCWHDFFAIYPDVRTLATASPDGLQAFLAPLGFKVQRREALQLAMRYLLEVHNGVIPASLQALENIPHVGLYASRAVLIFAFGFRMELVDTNILRFLARYYGVRLKNLDIRKNPRFFPMALAWVPSLPALCRHHHFGLLDFTAQVCRPRRPKCADCPLAHTCAFPAGRYVEM